MIDLARHNRPAVTSMPVDTGVDFILLTCHVTYWDYLGWKDIFGNKEFDDRQRSYVRRMGLRSAFTPQIIVNGRASGVGNSVSDLKKVLRDGGAGQRFPVRVSTTQDGDHGVVTVDASDCSVGRFLDVLVVHFDPLKLDVQIQKGENRGRKLSHLNVVREVRKVGELSGGEVQLFTLTLPQPSLRACVLIQDGPGGIILGVSSV